jgi:hypothetical protein
VFFKFALILFLGAASLAAQAPSVRFALPERVRLLEDQRVDIVIEARNFTAGTLRVTANGRDLTRLFSAPKSANLDCDTTTDAVFRADRVGFPAGPVRLEVTLTTPGGTLTTYRNILVQPFKLPRERRNVIVFIGDGMNEEWRTAGRIVSRGAQVASGVPGLREGFYDNLLEMD